MRATASLFMVVGLVSSTGCTSGSGDLGSAADAGVGSTPAASACTKQPTKLAEANCETPTLFDLYACDTGASPPSTECTRTTVKDAYCCPNALLTDMGPAKARAIVSSELEGSSSCSGPFIDLGTFSPVAPIYDGDANGTAAVSCLIAAAGDGFDITAKASDPSVGSVEATGRLQSSEPAGTLDIVFDRKGERITRSKCTAKYPSPAMGVAEGRVWVTLTCPGGTGAEPASCGMTATIRFENCLPKK